MGRNSPGGKSGRDKGVCELERRVGGRGLTVDVLSVAPCWGLGRRRRQVSTWNEELQVIQV